MWYHVWPHLFQWRFVYNGNYGNNTELNKKNEILDHPVKEKTRGMFALICVKIAHLFMKIQTFL